MTQQIHPNLQAAYHSYSQPKPEGDIDLVAHVRQLLQEAGLGFNIENTYDSHHHVDEAKGKLAEVQRFLLNRYFTLQLSTRPNSLDVRCTLLPNGEISDWIRYFRESVLPFMIEHKLPIVLETKLQVNHAV